MVKIQLGGRFQKMYQELVQEDPQLIEVITKRVHWFYKNPQDTRLENHALTGRMEGKWAFSINKDVRIVYEWLGEKSVRLLAIGWHYKVYQRS